MYVGPLSKIKEVSAHLDRVNNYPNAEKIAQQILTLPTHYEVTESLIDRIVGVIKEHLKN